MNTVRGAKIRIQVMVKKTKNIIKNFEDPDNERQYLLAALKLKQREKQALVQNDFLEFI